MQHQAMSTTNVDEFTQRSSTFEAFEVSASGILLAIILYVIIVGPFFIWYKKLDKQ